MLSNRITMLFQMLSCSNTDIARFAKCTPSNISRIRSGGRSPKPSDRSIARLAEGVYGYADNENMLPLLCQLCNTNEQNREALIPAIIAWMYDTKEIILPNFPKPLRSISDEARRQSFWERLNAVMNLLMLSNTRLAQLVCIDPSLVSRFRSGIRSPHGNVEMSKALADTLFDRAQVQDTLAELSRLCEIPAEILQSKDSGSKYFLDWLFASEIKEGTVTINSLLDFIDSFSNSSSINIPRLDPSNISMEIEKVYRGSKGLQAAVIRFLAGAAKNGGELWLYSDEEMTWLAGDRNFFAKWSALMLACVKRGVKIKIIHNIDRGIDEMLSAIKGWLPLYMSGLIELYVCRKPRDTRFSHTIFLSPDAECILGSHVNGGAEEKWYDYVTDKDRLKALKQNYQGLIASSSPLLKTYIGE